MLFIAILILIFLMYRFFTFRAEMVFTMSLIAPIMIVIGACYLPGKYHEAGIFLLVIGAFMLAVVLLICRLTARGVEKGLRLEYYKNLIIYGALKSPSFSYGEQILIAKGGLIHFLQVRMEHGTIADDFLIWDLTDHIDDIHTEATNSLVNPEIPSS